MRLLMFSSDVDLNNDRLISGWESLGHEVWRVNYGGTGATICCDPVGAKIDVKREGRELPIDAFDRAWLRTLPFAHWCSQPEEAFVSQEIKAFYDAILPDVSGRWLNEPSCMAKARSKFRQLVLANEAGLNIAQTRFTNSLVLSDSYNDHVIKTMSGGLLSKDSINYFMPTMAASSFTDIETSAFRGIPLICQSRVFGLDARIFWIDGSVVAVSIDRPNNGADWRTYPPEKLKIDSVDVPIWLRTKISIFMKAINCRVAAIDFIIDDDGEWWFLESNLMGNWIWFEDITSLPITKMICAAIENDGRIGEESC